MTINKGKLWHTFARFLKVWKTNKSPLKLIIYIKAKKEILCLKAFVLIYFFSVLWFSKIQAFNCFLLFSTFLWTCLSKYTWKHMTHTIKPFWQQTSSYLYFLAFCSSENQVPYFILNQGCEKFKFAGVEFCRDLQESIWILQGGVCESLWTLLHSNCVKLLTVYESVSGLSQNNLVQVFAGVDSLTRVQILALNLTWNLGIMSSNLSQALRQRIFLKYKSLLHITELNGYLMHLYWALHAWHTPKISKFMQTPENFENWTHS